MGYAELARAVARMPEPPCNSGGVKCPLWDQCADLRLACEQFYVYAAADQDGKDIPNPTRVPTRELYSRVFSGNTKPFQVRPHRAISDELTAAIQTDPETPEVVAGKYGLSVRQVKHVLRKHQLVASSRPATL